MTFMKTNIDETNKKQVYRMTQGDSATIEGIEKGVSLPVELYALYDEDKTRKKQDGSEEEYTQRVLTFTSGGHKFGTISATFIKSFLDIVEIMEDEPFAIIITGGRSKNNRDYVNCELDCDFSVNA